jgi:voltage-gated potassium channel
VTSAYGTSGVCLIVGGSAVGLEVARQISLRGAPLRVVDADQAALAEAEAAGFATAVADVTQDEELARLGVGRDVETLFALLPDDAVNVFLVISARSLDPALRIIALAESPDSGRRLLAAGATKVIDPYEASGHKIYRMIAEPALTEILESTVFGAADLHIAQVEIQAGGLLEGIPLNRASRHLDHDVVVLGVVDREEGRQLGMAVRGDTRLIAPGDVLVVIGPRSELDRLRRDLSS